MIGLGVLGMAHCPVKVQRPVEVSRRKDFKGHIILIDDEILGNATRVRCGAL